MRQNTIQALYKHARSSWFLTSMANSDHLHSRVGLLDVLLQLIALIGWICCIENSSKVQTLGFDEILIHCRILHKCISYNKLPEESGPSNRKGFEDPNPCYGCHGGVKDS